MNQGSPIDVIYIASNGRSGSTLLDRALGQIDDVTSLGETRFIWSFGFVDNNLCECGEPFRSCPRWRRIADATLGDLAESELPRLASESARLLWNPSLIRLKGYFASREFRRIHDDHLQRIARLYEEISKEFQTSWFVDSSKLVTYAFLLSEMPNIRLHTVHLVRDSRAVAYSWTRKKVRSEITKQKTIMPIRPSWLTAFRWNLQNFLSQRLARISESYVRIRYEDFVQAPRESLARIAESVGLDSPDLGFVEGNTVTLQQGHTVAGNPSRFRFGSQKLVLDDEWCRQMPLHTRAPITLFTALHLLAYGYPLNPPPTSDATHTPIPS